VSASTPVRKPLWIRLASRTAGWFGVRFFNMLYGERSLVTPRPPVKPPPGLEIRSATPADLEALQSNLPAALARSCRNAVDHGSRCLVALSGSEIAGFSWLNTEGIYLSSWRLGSLPPAGAYTYNSFVLPTFRGQKIFQCLTESVYSKLEVEGFRFCCNLVDRHNAPSVAARRRLGAEFFAAPILKLPGLNPLPLRRLPFGVTVPGSQGV
jgi:hypothetical protein